MTFSGYNVEQRSKEVKALQSFITYSLIGSMTLHFGVLASGLGNFLARVPQDQEEPIEITLVEPITEEKEKPPEEIPEVKKSEPLPVSRSEPQRSIASSEIAIAPKAQPTVVTPVRSQPVIQKPVAKTVATEKPQPAIQPQQTKIPQATNTQPRVITSNSNSPETSTVVTQPQQTGQNSDHRLRQLLGGIRDSRATQGNANNTGVESNQTGGTGSTPRQVGSPTGNSPATTDRRLETLATAPTAPKIPTAPSNGNRSQNGRAACRECNAKYPEAARRRGIEGRVEVAVDTDAQGNVTNVRVARSSGNRELDEETLRQARNWKLKPAEGGRQGVAIATEFALQGSRRHRQVQEQKKRKEAEARNQQTTATNNDSTEGTRRRRRLVTSTDANVPAQTEPRVRRRQETRTETRRQPVESTNTPSSATRTGGARETLRRVRRERATNNAAPEAPQNTNRRRRRENGTSTSQDKLRATLRNLRQPSQSAPATQE
ncbi:energy transducer TonB [Anabaena subtropica]|uniref:TonB family protein n=1 Tax=Anabaena subtropica FACHB-260 TaxID=2692884 RepID=A0ABR8CS14_9NOST|nr:energy transducer TonB [Anabaena subtropica]MBD2345581.1 TonB family protein [Anabaena subtropica FACHB-260]